MTRELAIVLAAAWCVAGASLAQTADEVARAQRLVVTDPARASEYVAELRAKGAPEREFDLAFLAGVAAQRSAGEGAAKRDALEQARAAYAEAAELNPKSSAVAYNQFTVLATLGDEAGALRELERALALAAESKDPKLALYQLRYAESLAKREPEHAVQALEALLASAPGEARALALLEELYLAHSPEKLAALGARALAAGELAAAEQSALALLEAERTPADARHEALRLLAATWARSGSALTAARSKNAMRAFKAQRDAAVAARAQELLAALGGAKGEFPTWSRDTATSPSLARSGRAIFRDLLRALAQQWLRGAEPRAAEAERALLAAIPLGDHGPDPDAFLEATSVYANAARPEAIRALMGRYEFELFSEKSAAYARDDYALVHRMHLALGLTYAALDVWKSPSQFQNAFFQLDAAMLAARRFNERQPAGSKERLAAPALAIEKLAKAYDDRGDWQQGLRVRSEGSAALQAAGRLEEQRIIVENLRLQQQVRAEERLHG